MDIRILFFKKKYSIASHFSLELISYYLTMPKNTERRQLIKFLTDCEQATLHRRGKGLKTHALLCNNPEIEEYEDIKDIKEIFELYGYTQMCLVTPKRLSKKQDI